MGIQKNNSDRVATGITNHSSRTAVTRRVAFFLALCILSLGLLHLVSTVIMDHVSIDQIVRTDIPTYRLRFRMFSLDREMALPAWFSSLLMTFNGVLLLVLAWVRHHKQQGNVWAWVTMALVFFFLSIDESVAIHETLPERVREWLGPYATGLLYYAWYVPLLAVMAVLVWFWVPAWWRLPAALRWGLAGGVAVFIGGAVVVEAFMGMIMHSYGMEDPPLQNAPWSIKLLIVAEELVELLGMSIVACSLLHHLAPQLKLTVINESQPIV
ncbi:MAG: hypothetical protein AAF911_03735 [Planctomycetota bacterium]